MRPLLLVVFGLSFVSCQEEPPQLKFRTPQQIQTQNTPSSTSQSAPTLIISPQTEPVPTSSQPSQEPFYCELDGAPWKLAPSQKLQGLLIQRPELSKEQPSTKLITISLQGATKERLQFDITADTPTPTSAKITLTTKDTVAKTTATLTDVQQKEEGESTLLSFSLDAKLQPLGSPTTRELTNCRLRDVVIRSLQTEAPSTEE
jgi:hypothetical protein